MGYYVVTDDIRTLMIGIEFDQLTSDLSVKCINQAEAEINKYLSKRYDISSFINTTTSVPPIVRSLTEKLSVGYMYRYMARTTKDEMDRANEYIKDSLENLQNLSVGNLDLLNTAGSAITEKATSSYRIQSNTDGYHSTFDEDDPLKWKVDSNKLDDIADDRDT